MCVSEKDLREALYINARCYIHTLHIIMLNIPESPSAECKFDSGSSRILNCYVILYIYCFKLSHPFTHALALDVISPRYYFSLHDGGENDAQWNGLKSYVHE